MNGNPFAITISHTLGSGGAYVGEKLSERLGVPFLDREILKRVADRLQVAETELENRLSNGETMWQIAESKGLTTEQFNQLMIDARNAALDQMVASKQITQAQADLMKQHMTGGVNAGGCPMLGAGGAGRSGRSGGWGMMGRGNQ